MLQRFSSDDRKAVVNFLEKERGIRLAKIGNRPKYLEDNTGIRYCILGGYGDWHGIPSEVVSKELQAGNESVLIFAKRRDRRIEVFAGSLQLLVKNIACLSYTSQNQYEFTFEFLSSIDLRVKEVRAVRLSKIGEILAG